MIDILDKLEGWYAIAGAVLALVIQAQRRFPWLGAKLWAKLPDGSKFLVPLAWGAVIAFVGAQQAGQPLAEALKAAVGGAIAIGFGAMGVAAGLKESPIPWSGGRGGKPKPPDDDDKTPTDGKPVHVHLPLTVIALMLTGCGLLGGGAASADPCSFDNAAYSLKVAECDQKIGECPMTARRKRTARLSSNASAG
jgi:hypothetical protein